MHRDADDPPLIGNGPGDGLPDPPCRVGREPEPPVRFKLFCRLHQAKVPFLNEVKEGQPPPGIPLGHRDHQPQVGFAQFPPGIRIPGLRGPGKRQLLFHCQQRHPADLLQICLHRVIQRYALG